jgi:DNA modification methylase
MSPRSITENTLFYGDNLFILREHIPSESIDLVYLDPPFNSSRNYYWQNRLFFPLPQKRTCDKFYAPPRVFSHHLTSLT